MHSIVDILGDQNGIFCIHCGNILEICAGSILQKKKWVLKHQMRLHAYLLLDTSQIHVCSLCNDGSMVIWSFMQVSQCKIIWIVVNFLNNVSRSDLCNFRIFHYLFLFNLSSNGFQLNLWTHYDDKFISRKSRVWRTVLWLYPGTYEVWNCTLWHLQKFLFAVAFIGKI